MFTRKGDSGETDNPSRGRLSKGDMVVEIEGEIDSLISVIGLASTVVKWPDIASDLGQTQVDLFTIGEDILADGKKRTITEERTQWLEERTLFYRNEVGRIKLFVIPGGSEESAVLHVARTSARTVERMVVRYSDSIHTSKAILSYLNRLSSLLFMQSLSANLRKGIPERIWEIGRES